VEKKNNKKKKKKKQKKKKKKKKKKKPKLIESHCSHHKILPPINDKSPNQAQNLKTLESWFADYGEL